MSLLIAIMQRLTDFHSFRSLPILGRATIANSVILSMCWYIFREVFVCTPDIRKIQSVISSFISKSIFPRIKWSTITSPTSKCGLGIRDSHLQQTSLYYKWVNTLLSPNNQRNNRIATALTIYMRNLHKATNV